MSGITNPAEPYFKDGIWGWDGTVWRKLPLVWGYSEGLAESLSGVQSGDGDYTNFSTVVPSGEVHVIQSVSMRNDTGARGRAHINFYDGAVYHLAASTLAPALAFPTIAEGQFCLAPGSRIYIIQHDCLDADAITASLWGYKMKIAE